MQVRKVCSYFKVHNILLKFVFFLLFFLLGVGSIFDGNSVQTKTSEGLTAGPSMISSTQSTKPFAVG